MKGIQQEDPLSLYLFLLAVKLVVATINNNKNIKGLGKGRKGNIKCPSQADGLTLTLIVNRSVALDFETIEIFSGTT